jgi:hypothetical protein
MPRVVVVEGLVNPVFSLIGCYPARDPRTKFPAAGSSYSDNQVNEMVTKLFCLAPG